MKASECTCMCACEGARARACARACVRACMAACFQVSHVCTSGNDLPHFSPPAHVRMRRQPRTGTFVHTLTYMHADLMMRLEVLQRLHLSICVTSRGAQAGMRTSGINSASTISALSRHRRRHVYCAGMDVPVLKMSALARRSF